MPNCTTPPTCPTCAKSTISRSRASRRRSWSPDEYLGDVLKLCQDRRGIQMDLTYAGARAMVVYDLPLNEVVFDFYDRLKSSPRATPSFDYQMDGYRRGLPGEDVRCW